MSFYVQTSTENQEKGGALWSFHEEIGKPADSLPHSMRLLANETATTWVLSGACPIKCCHVARQCNFGSNFGFRLNILDNDTWHDRILTCGPIIECHVVVGSHLEYCGCHID